MERCHWESRLWIDGKEIGLRNGLSVPQVYELTNVLTPGKHIISFCVDNRIKNVNVGINSHSISDHTQGNWNGIIGDFYLEAHPLVNWKQVSVFPDIKNHILTIKASVRNENKKKTKAYFSFKLNVDTSFDLITKLIEHYNSPNFTKLAHNSPGINKLSGLREKFNSFIEQDIFSDLFNNHTSNARSKNSI